MNTAAAAEKAYRFAHMNNEERWREVRSLLRAMNLCECDLPCLNCARSIGDIATLTDLAIASFDGPES